MMLSEWYYLLIAALVNSFFVFLWQKFLIHKQMLGFMIWASLILGSFFNAWALDVLHRQLGITELSQMMQLILGCWLFILVASEVKHYALNGWSWRSFWLNYLGELISFTLMGLVIFALT
jgi:hypothetical protein